MSADEEGGGPVAVLQDLEGDGAVLAPGQQKHNLCSERILTIISKMRKLMRVR